MGASGIPWRPRPPSCVVRHACFCCFSLGLGGCASYQHVGCLLLVRALGSTDGGRTDEGMDSVEIAGAADERRGSGEGPGWEPDVGDIQDLLGSMQLEPRSLAPGVLLVDGDASGGDVDTGRAKGASLELAAVDLHAHQLGATGADAVTARRVGSFKQRAGDGGVGETDVNASGGSGRQTKAHLAVVGDGGGSSDSSLGGPIPEVHHGGTAESLLVPCSVRIFLEEYYEASQSSRGITVRRPWPRARFAASEKRPAPSRLREAMRGRRLSARARGGARMRSVEGRFPLHPLLVCASTSVARPAS